jgi:hypothetical protein
MSSKSTTPVVNPIAQEEGTAYIAVQGESFGDLNAGRNGGQSKRREHQACCACTLVSLFIFLMCFFLIPRTPTLWLSDLTFAQADDDTTAVSNTKGKFVFKNNNYFGVKWKDVDVKLYWLLNPGQILTYACAQSTDINDVCAFYYGGDCAVPIGDFSNTDHFETDTRETVKRSLPLTQTQQEQACSAQVIYAGGYDIQRLLTKGTAEASSSSRNFGKVHVSDTVYGYYA